MRAKRVIIIHGWGDDPTQGWIDWLAGQLESRGIEAIAPAMPNSRRPDFEDWLRVVSGVVGEFDEQTVLIGHSLGCFILLRFLERYHGAGRLGKLILIAGFIVPADPKHQARFEPTPDFAHIRSHIQQIFCIYSNDDHVVLPSRSKALHDKLGGQLVLDAGKRHFAGLRGISELPSVLNIVLDNS